MSVRLPDNTHRRLYIGRTGAGKSQGAIGDDLLHQNWNTDGAWVIIDYKGEDLIADIRKQNPGRIKEISITDKPPTRPGLYYMRPRPMYDDDAMEAWMLSVHAMRVNNKGPVGGIGIYVDEGYALPSAGKSPAFTLLLTQGRTLRIPIICLYQRPTWMSRFVVEQSDFVRMYKISDIRDRKTINNFLPPAILPNGSKLGPMEINLLPNYFSMWHDVGRGQTAILSPAPERKAILQAFKVRLNPQYKRTFV